MRRPNRSRVVALAAVLAVAFAVHSKGSAEQADDGGRGYAEQDWPFVAGNWSSSRYSTLTGISTETIDRLGGAWVTRLEGGASSRATPVVKDGVILSHRRGQRLRYRRGIGRAGLALGTR